jgi:hypothetical protein
VVEGHQRRRAGGWEDVFEYDNDGKMARCTTFFEGG